MTSAIGKKGMTAVSPLLSVGDGIGRMKFEQSYHSRSRILAMTSAICNKGMTAVSQVSIMYHVSTKTKPGLNCVLLTLPRSRDIHPPCLLLFVKIYRTVGDEKIESSFPTYFLTTSFGYLSASRPVKASAGGGNTV